MKTVTYADALKILGLKGRPSEQEVRKAYLKLAKKWHPDVNSSPEATDVFKRISLANIVLKAGPGVSLSFKDIRPEYRELKQMVAGDFSLEDLNEAEISLIKKYRDVEGKQKKIQLAKDLIVKEFDALESIRSRNRSRIVKNARMNLASPEEKAARDVQKMIQEMQFQSDVKELKSKLQQKVNSLYRSVVIKNGKARIPILSKVKGKNVVKLVLATASLIGLILAGKYVYDAKNEAFKSVKLLTGGSKK